MSEAPYSTVPLPDNIIIGGPWPDTIIAWPNGTSRRATKPEYDLFQALEKAQVERNSLIIAFVQGAQWWEYESRGATMWASDRNKAEAQAEKRLEDGTLGKFPNPKHQHRKDQKT